MKLVTRVATGAEVAATVALAAMLGMAVLIDVVVVAARQHDWGVELVVAGAMWVLVLTRGRDPLRAVAVGLGICLAGAIAGDVWGWPSQPGVAATIGLLVLGASAVRNTAPRPAALVAVCGVLVLTVGRFELRGQYVMPFAFLGVLSWMLALGVGILLRLADTQHRLVLDTAAREVRLQLARDLHDVVAHHVAGIVVQAQAAQVVATAQSGDKGPTLATLADIETAGNEALEAMRRVVGWLRDPADSASLAPAVGDLDVLVAAFADRSGGLQVRLDDDLSDADGSLWPPEVASTVYRVVQEALTNVVLHAPGASDISVVVRRGTRQVEVEITDDGPTTSPPVAPGPGAGHGLVGMRERVHVLGGTLSAGPAQDRGWSVHATVPVRAGGPR